MYQIERNKIIVDDDVFNKMPEEIRKCFTIIHTNPECPCYMLDRQSGKTGAFAPVKSGQKGFGGTIYGKYKTSGDDGKTFYGDGLLGASRFFYCAKASKGERNKGLENGKTNIHPTVKPISLLQYLCLLTKTPTGGIVLDCFAGSGTTGMACKKQKRPYILIEKEPEYVEIARARIDATLEPLF